MPKIKLWIFLIFVNLSFAQQSDFSHIDFSKADNIAKTVKSKRLYQLHKLTYSLTKNLNTDIEKFRAIYIWICNNIANDFGLYSLNEKKRKRFLKDSVKLKKWNSKFKKKLFKKLLKKKRTICTGYAYLLKEMSAIVGIKSKMINGIGRTSSVDLSGLAMPNHTWNAVKLNDKWYLCDPTWATGISFPEEGTFKFMYNEGYFLTEPKLFFLNHFPLEKKYTLLDEKTTSFKGFTEAPLLYGDAYTVLKRHIFPKKMHHNLNKNDTFSFKYQLIKKTIPNKVKLVIDSGTLERTIQPKVDIQNEYLTVQHTFKTKGFFDVHLYIEKKLIATYTFNIKN